MTGVQAVARWTARSGSASIAALVLVAALTGSADAPAGGAPTRAVQRVAPRAAAPVEPRILVDRSVARPSGLAVTDDGTVYVSEPGTGRVVRRTSEGTEVVLRLDAEHAPNGLALADDGTLVVAATTAIVTLASDGTRHDLPVEGATDIEAVDVDAAGTVFASERSRQRVLRVDPDGSSAVVPFTGLGEVAGIDVDDAGTVSVIDISAGDVVQRTAGGVQTAVGIAGLGTPIGLDITGGRMLISDVAGFRLLVREADGTVQDLATDLATPQGVALLADGTAYVAVDGTTGCRCPDGPGNVTRVPAGGTSEVLGLGDQTDIGAVAAAGPSTVLYTSSPGAPGYSTPNPLRRVVGDGPAEDLATGGPGPTLVDAAPDGTAYVVQDGTDSRTVVRRAPDGTTITVAIPPVPGMDDVFALAVDEHGRLFVALGSGYGTGGFRVVEPLAAGGAKERFRSTDFSTTLEGLAVGAGALHLAIGSNSGWKLLRVDLADGEVTRQTPLELPPASLDADAHGNLYIVGYRQEHPLAIRRLAPDGTVSTIDYTGSREPVRVSIGTDGTLDVVDAAIGIVALAGVGPVGVPSSPGEPAPATPVAGDPSFTG